MNKAFLQAIFDDNDWIIFLNSRALELLQDNQTISGELLANSLGYPVMGDFWLTLNPGTGGTEEYFENIEINDAHIELDRSFINYLIEDGRGTWGPRMSSSAKKAIVNNIDNDDFQYRSLKDSIDEYRKGCRLINIADNLLEGHFTGILRKNIQYYVKYSTLADAEKRAEKLSKYKVMPYVQKDLRDY
ncbi:MAG: hypothetical protein JXA43_02040 [Candidatus Diapherotrites archaeon]|nr:hypothetical protein [Candidatus Diapherotrites archaeon]